MTRLQAVDDELVSRGCLVCLTDHAVLQRQWGGVVLGGPDGGARNLPHRCVVPRASSTPILTGGLG